MSLMSPPAQKCPPAPRMTTARMLSSCSTSLNTVDSSATMWRLMALRTSGLLIVMSSVGPCFSRIRVSHCGNCCSISGSVSGRHRVLMAMFGALWAGRAFRDCLQQGCCSQAYMDVFTACPGKLYLPIRPCRALVAFLARQGTHQLADDAQHDFVGTAANGDQPHVAVGP